MSEFDTPLTPEEQQAYQAWAKAGGRDPEGEQEDYDLQGYYKAGGTLGAGHMPDTFKKPNHPTFSTESQYNGVNGAQGGSWQVNPDGTYTFTAGRSNLEHWGPQGLQNYFNKYEKGNRLVIPEGQD